MATFSLSAIRKRFQTRWHDKHFVALTLIFAIVAATIAVLIGIMQSVWFDEAYSVSMAQQPLSQLLSLISSDAHPPLYYVYLKMWGSWFGFGEMSLRLSTGILFGGAVVVTGLLAKRLFGTKAALTILPLIAFSPFLLRYGFEARMYVLAILISLGATWALICTVETGKWSARIAYGLLVVLGMYTLYVTVFLWIAQAIWVFYQRQKPLRWLATYCGALLLFIPWLPVVATQFSSGAVTATAHAMTLTDIVNIVTFGFLYQPAWQLNAATTLLALLVFAAVSIAVVKAWPHIRRQKYALLVLVSFVVPLVSLFIIAAIKPLYLERYSVLFLPWALMFFGLCIAQSFAKMGRTARTIVILLPVILAVGVLQLAASGNYNFQRLQKPAIRQVAEIASDCRKGTTIVAGDPYIAIELGYYLPNCQVNFLSPSPVLKAGFAALSGSPLRVSNPERQLPTSRRLMYVYYDRPMMTVTTMPLEATSSFDNLTIETYSAR